jgi:hypothetical protein
LTLWGDGVGLVGLVGVRFYSRCSVVDVEREGEKGREREIEAFHSLVYNTSYM